MTYCELCGKQCEVEQVPRMDDGRYDANTGERLYNTIVRCPDPNCCGTGRGHESRFSLFSSRCKRCGVPLYYDY